MIQLQQGVAYGDNRRDVSEAAFEADVPWRLRSGTCFKRSQRASHAARRGRHRNHASFQVLVAVGGAAEQSSGARNALLIAKSCIVERRRSGERKVIVIPPEILTMVMLIK
jgi:hypothetical protein